jgi:aspartate racemase
MATLGIIGGIAPPSTVEYYNAAIEIYRARAGGRSPLVLVNSIDGDEVFDHLSAGRHQDVAALISQGLRQLAAGGATVALLASASVHVAFELIRRTSPLPLIDIVAATAEACEGYRNLALFATSFTAKADLFGPALAAHGITVTTPSGEEQADLHRIYFDELVRGEFLTASRHRLLEIADRMQSDSAIDGVLLAGTELPLLLPHETCNGLHFLDTGRAHVDLAVRAMLDDGP